MPTKISWADASWSPIIGCSKISSGCKHCYAERMACRLAHMGNRNYQDVTGPFENRTWFDKWNGETVFVESALTKPLHWRKPRKIFVNSMGDTWHESVPFEWIDRIMAVAALCPQHTFLFLTKRAERMREYMMQTDVGRRVENIVVQMKAGREPEDVELTKEIEGCPGYFITNKGRVFSDRANSGKRVVGKRHEVKPLINREGYVRVMLYVAAQAVRPSVHRLVLSAFDRPPKENEQTRHIDGNPQNNALSNLLWGTDPENKADCKRHGTHRRYSKLTETDVNNLRGRRDAGDAVSILAEDFSISETQVYNIIQQKQWKGVGLPWPLENIHCGVTVENQDNVDRILDLVKTPAAKRFLSIEPLLEDVSMPAGKLEQIDSAFIGCESGTNARLCTLRDIRIMMSQCRDAGVKVHVKQIPLDGKCNKNFDEWPPEFQVREV